MPGFGIVNKCALFACGEPGIAFAVTENIQNFHGMAEVAAHHGHLFQVPAGNMEKGDTVRGGGPYSGAVVFHQPENFVIGELTGAAGNMSEGLKLLPVVALESVGSAEPHEPMTVL